MCKCLDLFDDVFKDFTDSQTAFEESQLIPVLQKLQEKYGYLPQEVIKRLSEKTGIFVSKIMGVVTFYSQFRLQPVGDNIVRICFGTACHVIGAENVADAICRELDVKLGDTTQDKLFTVESVACLGCCSLAPVIMINDETHGRLTPDTARGAIKEFMEKSSLKGAEAQSCNEGK
ncbi:MAG: NADH-quinone oxidoreductase subunit NuoE [Treponema sp.]|nr:NADH-quinone oxidoreductase subunit NuoE [Treponema sp.]